MSQNEFTKANAGFGLSKQVILDAGLNVFALELLIESFTKLAGDRADKVEFVFCGVTVGLQIGDNTGVIADLKTDCELLLKQEHELSDAYLRIRGMLKAFPPMGCSKNDVWEHTESKLEELIARVAELEHALDSCTSSEECGKCITTPEIHETP